MSNELLASKVVFQEEAPAVRQIPGVATSTSAVVGVTEKGPVGEATLITSDVEFKRIFGNVTANATDLPLAIEGFFENGGQRVYVTRTVHYTDIDNVNSKISDLATATFDTDALAASAGTVLGSVAETFDLLDGDTLEIDRDAFGVAVATFNAAASTSTAANTENYALVDSQTLTVEIDGGSVQTITFLTAEFVSIGAATAAEVAAVINAKISGASCDVVGGAPRIISDKLGTASLVDVTGGTAAAAFGFPAAVAGTGDAADSTEVTVAEIKTLVEGDVSGVTVTDEGGLVRISSNTTGLASLVHVQAASTMDTKLGLDNAAHAGGDAGAVNTLRIDGRYDGAYGNDLRVDVVGATSGVATEFNLQVYRLGVLVENFPNLTMDETAGNYVEAVVNLDSGSGGSAFIAAVDLEAAVAIDDRRPVNATNQLQGGDDGLAGLVDDDFVGSAVALNGMRSFDRTNGIALLAIPGRATTTVHNAMLTYCSVIRNRTMFTVLDPPENQSAVQMIDYVKTTAQIQNTIDSEFGAIYWPRITIDNPDTSIFGNENTVVVPPSGHLLGMYARTDNSQPDGVSEAPAGIEVGQLRGMRGVETTEVNDEAKRDLVYPELINPITAIDGKPNHVDGSRTLRSTGNFPTIGERRLVIFIETSLSEGLEILKHRKIKRSTRARATRNTTQFLLTRTRNGAFASDVPSEAFFVDFGDTLNPPSVAFQRKIIGRVGLATAKPAEYIVVFISQDQRALLEELATAA